MRAGKLFILTVALFMVCIPSICQDVWFGSKTHVWTGNETVFYAGSNVNFQGRLDNRGTISGAGNLNVGTNKNIGNIQFVGPETQFLVGDSINIRNLELNKALSSKVRVRARQLEVSNTLNLKGGIIQTEDDGRFYLTGSSGILENGYVEGNMTLVSLDAEATLPVGINGFANYVTITRDDTSVPVRVVCQVPQHNTWPQDENMVGIADEVEWVLSTSGSTTNTQLSINFSGADLENFPNYQPIPAHSYAPSLALFNEDENLYRSLLSTDARVTQPTASNASLSDGVVVSNERVKISTHPTRFSISWIPLTTRAEFFVPNAFAPEAVYLENQRFRPFFSGAKVKSISIMVYNEFRTNVYAHAQSGEDLDLTLTGWDGLLPSGEEAPPGFYYYSIKIESDAGNHNKSGTFLLVRK